MVVRLGGLILTLGVVWLLRCGFLRGSTGSVALLRLLLRLSLFVFLRQGGGLDLLADHVNVPGGGLNVSGKGLGLPIGGGVGVFHQGGIPAFQDRYHLAAGNGLLLQQVGHHLVDVL